MQTVELLRGSPVSAQDILEFGATRVVLATGSHWRRDGIGRTNTDPIAGFDQPHLVLTPEDIFEGVSVRGPIAVFDDDHYYLGAVIAEQLRGKGLDVALVTPAERVSAWTVNTLEQHAIQKRILELGIEVLLNRNAIEFDGNQLTVACTYSGRIAAIPAACVVTVTSRLPNEDLALSLTERQDAVDAAGIASIISIGDCFAPSTIAAAVYAGHRYAREFDRAPDDGVPFLREMPA
jgi:dimethylamine/trimethylamine dehydrogenase